MPNVSLIVETNGVVYNPIPPETKLVVYYGIQDISSPTTVHTNYRNSFKSMEIDGADSVDITTQGNIQYQFNSVGEHIIKYEPVDSTVGSNSPLFFNIAIPMRVIIPDTFTQIGANAFLSCTGLISCTIGSGVTSIGYSAFQNCSSLTSVTIGNSVTSIDYSVFQNCYNLTSIDIPSGVTSIGNNAFNNCDSLTSIDIPSGVTSIGMSAFVDCSALTSVTVEATTPPNISSGVFDGNADGRKIYVPSASVNAYKAATNWSDYASDIEPIS